MVINFVYIKFGVGDVWICGICPLYELSCTEVLVLLMVCDRAEKQNCFF